MTIKEQTQQRNMMITNFVSACMIILIAGSAIFADADIYKFHGAIVIDCGKPVFQANGVIFGGVNSHEYGHYLQQLEKGSDAYYATVAAPSIVINILTWPLYACGMREFKPWYRKLPWECEADVLGNNAYHFHGEFSEWMAEAIRANIKD